MGFLAALGTCQQLLLEIPWPSELILAYWHRKYHSGTICKGVSNVETSNALSGCDKEEIEKKDWKMNDER